MSRVYSHQNVTRPLPPSTPPPPPPRVKSNEDVLKISNLLEPLAFMRKPLHPVLSQKRSLEEELSTAAGSSDDELDHATNSPLPRSPRECEVEDFAVTRDVMLYHRSLCALATPTRSKGLHCVAFGKLASAASSDSDALTVRDIAVGQPPALAGFLPPPGLESFGGAPLPTYSPPTFRKELMSVFKDLAADSNVARAVRRVRAQRVPRERQAAEIADAVTYVLEEPRGAARRSFIAFLGGLTAAFEKAECAAGLELFFRNVYPDLHDEVPRLTKIVIIELLPTLGSFFSAEELQSFLPTDLAVCCRAS